MVAAEADPARARAAGRREMRDRGLKDGMVFCWGLYARL